MYSALCLLQHSIRLLPSSLPLSPCKLVTLLDSYHVVGLRITERNEGF